MQKPLFISSKMSGSIGESHDFKINFIQNLNFLMNMFM